MAPKISVITPTVRGIKQLSVLLNDFKNQTFKDFEHLIIYDGTPPDDVKEFMKKTPPYVRFHHIEKDYGNMDAAPGTNARNFGIKISLGEYLVFCDDDDRYKDTYLESLISGTHGRTITIVQMSCQQSRMYKDGSPDIIVLVPEIGLYTFPICCHVGTPCFIVPRQWAVEEPWQHETEHDYRFIKRICEKYQPEVRIVGGMQVDVDGLVIKDMKDWVSIPPFYRE